MSIVVFPAILPTTKGRTFEEGPATDEVFVSEFEKINDLYEDFLRLRIKIFQVGEDWIKKPFKCPKPATMSKISFETELPLNVLINH